MDVAKYNTTQNIKDTYNDDKLYQSRLVYFSQEKNT